MAPHLNVLTFRNCLMISLAFWLAACVPPPAEQPFAGIVVDLNDPITRRVYEHQNNRNVDSLLTYLRHESPSYRYQAARALGSFPSLSRTASTALLEALDDRYELVKSAAAYAIGQSGDESLAEPLTAKFDISGQLEEYNAAVLAAVGKIGDARSQVQITDVTTYTSGDTLLQTAQLRSLYYFALREQRTDRGDSLVLAQLLDVQAPESVRQVAGQYALRFPFATTDGEQAALRNLLRVDDNPDAMMGIIRLLGRAGNAEARVALSRTLQQQTDWRIRVEALKALGSFEYALVRDDYLRALTDEHPLVRLQVGSQLLANGDAADATFYFRTARDSARAGDVRYALYAAANRHLPLNLTDSRGRINYDLQRAFGATNNVYEQRQILLALAEFPWNYRTIYDLYSAASSPVVRTAAAEALHNISQREDFDGFFRRSASRVRLDLASFFQEMVTTLAVGPAYYASEAIAADPDVYRPLYPDQTWLRSALNAFKLPKEIEAYYAVDAARAALAGEAAPERTPPSGGGKAINWELLGEAGQDIQVRTTAGRFTLRLYPDLAPAASSNFLELAGDGYYDGKVFHRIVPNFVAQGGGPLGDGFGAEDYALRTETPGLTWDRPGLVGLASAGKDTEGVQFFVTHRATPHLDGNYTIFGEITEGQDVVDQITPGTEIEEIVIR